MKKVLVIGSGGREHAIAYKFKESKYVQEVFVAPGNPGMSDVATLVSIDQMDFDGLINFCHQEKIDLVFVGPEIPLCAGIVDAMLQENINVFGPDAYCANLEGSKSFSKQKMNQFNVPTAAHASFDDYQDACAYLKTQKMPIVLKADGLAAGKGVLILETLEEALKALEDLMVHKLFDDSSSTVVIEEFLQGEEFSLFVLVNEDVMYPFEIAQDHKRAFDHDEGLNTGGMGAYTPVNHLPEQAKKDAFEQIVKPMVLGLNQEGHPFTGLLYAGCMLCEDGVKTIEYNVRFGDPETEVLLLALENDLYEAIENLLAKNHQYQLAFKKEAFVGVVMASNGYPETSTKGVIINGLENVNAPIFHMGTAIKDNHLVTNGGRVLFVVGSGNSILEAKQKVYHEIEKIQCDALFYRKDISDKAL
ncbi:MAG: phosphoribosylamine--glycine ligase [Erysipelotrichaceae bacterium]